MHDADAYLSESKKKRKRQRHVFAIFSILLFGAAGIRGVAWALIESGALTVREVEITGETLVPLESVKDLLRATVPGASFRRSLFGFGNMLGWPKEISPSALAFNPIIREIKIERKFFARKISIRVGEREAYGVWCVEASADCVWFDEGGIAFKKSPRVAGMQALLVNDYSKEKRVGIGEKVLEGEFLKNLLSIFEALRGSGIPVEEVALKHLEFQEVEVKTKSGPTLYFSLRTAHKNLADTVKAIAAREGFASLKYVDFRIEDKVFYR